MLETKTSHQHTAATNRGNNHARDSAVFCRTWLSPRVMILQVSAVEGVEQLVALRGIEGLYELRLTPLSSPPKT